MANYTKGRNKDHDIFIRGILSLHELVLLLLYRYIPKSAQHYINFRTLRNLSDTHITNKLLAQYSDSIHECELIKEQLPEEFRNNPDLPAMRACFLWEAKSSKPNQYIETQVEPYRYALVNLDRKNKKHPSIVIPIIFYHGATKWDKKMLYDDFKDKLPPDLLEFVPKLKYIIIDIQNTTKEEIEKMVDLGVLRAAFLTLKNAHDKNFFKNNMEEPLKFVENLPTEYVFQEFFKMLLEYMERRSGLKNDEFNKIVEQKLDNNMGASRKTMFEVAEERAELRAELRKARLTVVRSKWQKLPLDAKALAIVAELPLLEVENLLKSYDQVYEMWQKKDFENKTFEHLSVPEVNYLLELFEKY
jgi:Putative transposase, YhgA-like